MDTSFILNKYKNVKPLDDFDWSIYDNNFNGGNSLVKNTKVKTRNKYDKVYSHYPYAAELYKKYNSEKSEVNEIKDATKGSLHKVCNISKSSPTEVLVDTEGGSSFIVDINKEKTFINYLGVNDTTTFLNGLSNDEFKADVLDKCSFVKVIKHERISLWEGHLANIESELMQQVSNTDDTKKFAYYATIKSINNGGFLVDIMGVQCFMPGSLAAAGIITDFESMIGRVIPVMIVNYLPKSGFVVSYKKYLNYIMPSKIENELYIGKEIYTRVTGSSKNGLFVQFKDDNGEWLFTGLIHRSSMSPDFEQRFDSREFINGDEFKSYVYKIIEEHGNYRIIISDYVPKVEEEKE